MLSLLGSLRGGSSFITNSLRFRSSASAYLSRTPSVAGNRKTWTWSGWVKRGGLPGVSAVLFGTGDSVNNNSCQIRFNTNNQLEVFDYPDGPTGFRMNLITTQVFRDVSAWGHVVVAVDTTQAVSVNKVKIYWNGIEITSFSTSTYPGVIDTFVNSAVAHGIGRGGNFNGTYLDGYLADVNFIDGQALTPASFGAIDSSTGVWAPRPYSGTYGTNGFYLKFANTSSVAALGNDSSGNNNTWTVNNVSLTAGATYDSMIDVPVNYSDGGNGRGNYAVLNPLVPVSNTSITNANLTANVITASRTLYANLDLPTSGKWYCEFTPAAIAGTAIGIHGDAAQAKGYWSNGTRDLSNAYGATYTVGDVIGCAFNVDSSSVEFFKNGVSQGVQTSVALNQINIPMVSISGTSTAHINFGQRPFTYTPPAGFRALNTNNLPTPSIVNGANFMAATTYTGNAAARSLSNAVNSVSFQPDLVWIKSRTPGATNHALFDSTRGTTKYLSSNTTTGETTLAQSLTAFGADGFSLGTDTTLVNANANSYVAWQWKESVAAGLDVVTYTGTGVARTVAHNLGKKPSLIICKGRDTLVPWECYHSSLGATKYILLNSTTQAVTDIVSWNNTEPTSSVFTVGTSSGTNKLNENIVAYCFAEIAGFSRFGSYTGNGLADGPFVFCGFRPRFVMVKAAVGGAGNWCIWDSARNTFNVMNDMIQADLPATEVPGTTNIDFLSNGFKPRFASSNWNGSGVTYIFAAFAEVPSKYALAR